jgi:3-oxoacyl-(acyl-carrier-protein) synthase
MPDATPRPAHACITGLGFVTSIGNDTASVLHSLRTLASGVRPHRFLGERDRSGVQVAGVVQGFDFQAPSWAGWKYPDGYAIPKDLLRGLPPHGLYAFCAAEQALAQAGLDRTAINDPGVGLFCASAGSPMLMYRYLDLMHKVDGRRGNPMGVVSTISGTLNFNLAAHYGIRGANVGFVSACASSSHALGYALDEIRLGRQNTVMVIGAEDFTAESLLPFAAMNALSQGAGSDASRPWDTSRDGFVATGGAVALILEAPAQARARGVQPLALLSGWGQASDGVDKTASHPQGDGLVRAMSAALADAAVPAAAIDYVNAHATSTRLGDISEANALSRVFRDHGHNPPVSSTKGITGHGLSMAGAMEAAFCTLFLRHGFIAGNAHLREVDPACARLDLPRVAREQPVATILSNSSGFGGANVALVLRKA